MHRGIPLERTEEGSILPNESGPATTAAEREEGRRVKRIRVDLTRVSTLYWQAWLRVAGCKRASRDRWLVLFERNRLKDREAKRERERSFVKQEENEMDRQSSWTWFAKLSCRRGRNRIRPTTGMEARWNPYSRGPLIKCAFIRASCVPLLPRNRICNEA